MLSTLTSKGQVTIAQALRQRLGLVPGQAHYIWQHPAAGASSGLGNLLLGLFHPPGGRLGQSGLGRRLRRREYRHGYR
jgi:hypothetical protein